MTKTKLLEFREKINLTQDELAEKSGVSIRTIQRIEAGVEPKGYTLKSLAKALDITEAQLSPNTSEKPDFNYDLIKLINLSTILFFIPLGNILIPVIIMYLKKEVNPLTKQIVSLK